MMNQKLFLLLLACTLCACPAAAISRWFSATYNDLKFTLYRFGYCYNGLLPLNSSTMSESQFLVHQMRSFLDQANYDNEQLANVSALMDGICRSDSNYAVSSHINLTRFDAEAGKENRCNAIEDAMDSMYYVFKRAALNRSEPLDFASIQFYPNATDKNASYNVLDLITVSWIKSSLDLEGVCNITGPIKEYIARRTSNSSAQARAEPSTTGPVGVLLNFLNSLLDPLLGLQKRLYWESTTRLGQIQSGLSSGVSSLGSGLSKTRQRLFGSRATNATNTSAFNATLFNSTRPATTTTTNVTKPLNGTSILNGQLPFNRAPSSSTSAPPKASATTSGPNSLTTPHSMTSRPLNGTNNNLV